MAENPQQGDSAPDLVRSWTDYFRNPAVISGLLQFGATAMTPGSGGIGPALSAGAEAANRALQFQQATQSAQTSAQLKAREVGAKERTAAAAEQRAGAQERRDESRLMMDQEKLGLARERLKVWEKSLGRARATNLTDNVFNMYAKIAQDALSGLTELPPEVMSEIEDDPAGWAMRRTMESGAGVTGTPTGAGAQASATTAGEPTQTQAPISAQEPAQGRGAFPTGPGEITTPGANAPTYEQQLTDQGYPPFESLTDDQWRAIFADPQLEQEAIGAYGWREVKAKSYQLGIGAQGGASVQDRTSRAEAYRREQDQGR